MRGLDTNILVRYLAADDARQTAAAEHLLEESQRKDEPLFLPVLVLCELVWVLNRRYGQSKAQIAQTLERVLSMQLLRFEHEALVRRSLAAYQAGKADFPDYLMGQICLQAGCRDIVTFDRDLKGAPGYTVMG
jgi:predicted nucleic-acid-binding protein